MTIYHYCDTLLRSDLELPELQAADAINGQWTLHHTKDARLWDRAGWGVCWRLPNSDTDVLDNPQTGQLRMEFGKSAVFEIDDQEIRVAIADEVPPQRARHFFLDQVMPCLLYTSPSPRDATLSRMPSSA